MSRDEHRAELDQRQKVLFNPDRWMNTLKIEEEKARPLLPLQV